MTLILSVIIFVLSSVCGLYAADTLPDTGQTKFYNNTEEITGTPPAPGEAFYGQDAHYNPAERQHSYTKLDAASNALPDSADEWYQVKDNVTGLIWEVKTDDGSVHDKDNTYTWYDSHSSTHGPDVGTPGAGTDTADFINALNSENTDSGYCGHTDWRLPTIKELSGLVDSGRSNQPYINTTYFTQAQSSYYWSSTPDAGYSNSTWLVRFDGGGVDRGLKSYDCSVRAVRSGL